MAARVCVVGSCNQDQITYAARLPGPGETLMGDSFQVGFGGKGANQCVMAARLSGGDTVSMVGALGSDSIAKDTLQHFSEEGVDVSHMRACEGVSSGVAPIWVDAKGENSIIVVPGANALVSEEQATAALAALKPSVVLCQNEIPLSSTAAALAAGRAGGAITFFSPAPAPKEPLPEAMYAATSVLLPNVVEAAQLSGCSTGSGAIADVVGAAEALLARGCSAVVVTLGSRGSVVMCAGDAATDALHVPSVRVATVVDTTGAGDAFSGSLAFFYSLLLSAATSAATSGPAGSGAVDKKLLVEAVRRATFVAADTVTKKGTQSSYARRSELPSALFLGPSDAAFAAWAETALPVPVPVSV
jgi:ribokinase